MEIEFPLGKKLRLVTGLFFKIPKLGGWLEAYGARTIWRSGWRPVDVTSGAAHWPLAFGGSLSIASEQRQRA
jgi:hypothetical protein